MGMEVEGSVDREMRGSNEANTAASAIAMTVAAIATAATSEDTAAADPTAHRAATRPRAAARLARSRATGRNRLHPRPLPRRARKRLTHPPSMESNPGIRVDRWLWAVRLYKTRTQASAACGGGHVQVNGLPCKPARLVRPGDLIQARTGEVTRTVKVLAVLQSRVGAKLVGRYLEDLTPASEYEQAREKARVSPGLRPKGTGRPTKKERRVLGSFFGLDEP
jgi:ribosome-associated heat shock protein Hsp15